MQLRPVSRISVRIGVAAAAIIAAQPAMAQTAMMYGVGGKQTCGEYLRDRESKSEQSDALLVTWALGFASGFNMGARQQIKGDMPNGPSQLAYFAKYCREHPLDFFASAMLALLKEMGGRRR